MLCAVRSAPISPATAPITCSITNSPSSPRSRPVAVGAVSITKDSYVRKAIRDLTGQTFGQTAAAFVPVAVQARRDRGSAVHDSFVSGGADKMARFLAVNALLFTLFWLMGAGIWFWASGCWRWRPGCLW